MDSYIVDRGNFEKFFINNFTSFIDKKFFTITYNLFGGDVIRHYREFEVEGVSLIQFGIEEDAHDYIAFIVANEQKIRQVKFLKTMIENQKRFEVNEK